MCAEGPIVGQRVGPRARPAEAASQTCRKGVRRGGSSPTQGVEEAGVSQAKTGWKKGLAGPEDQLV